MRHEWLQLRRPDLIDSAGHRLLRVEHTRDYVERRRHLLQGLFVRDATERRRDNHDPEVGQSHRLRLEARQPFEVAGGKDDGRGTELL